MGLRDQGYQTPGQLTQAKSEHCLKNSFRVEVWIKVPLSLLSMEPNDQKDVCFHCYFSFLRYSCGSPGLVLPRSLETAHFLCHPILNENGCNWALRPTLGGLLRPDDSSSTSVKMILTTSESSSRFCSYGILRNKTFKTKTNEIVDTTQHFFLSPVPRRCYLAVYCKLDEDWCSRNQGHYCQ